MAIPVQAPDKLPEPLTQRDINPRGWFVQNNDRGAMDQRLGYQNPTLHATRQTAHRTCSFICEIKCCKQLVDPVIILTNPEITRL